MAYFPFFHRAVIRPEIPHILYSQLQGMSIPIEKKVGEGHVGLSMMCYTLGKEKRTCLGDFQLSGLIGKLLY